MNVYLRLLDYSGESRKDIILFPEGVITIPKDNDESYRDVKGKLIAVCAAQFRDVP